MKRILVTGTNSYIGKSLKQLLGNYPDKYSIDSVSLRDNLWKEKDFSRYDVVFHVAAIVHQREKPGKENLYFKINRDLTVKVAKMAQEAGVNQFIFMSTMAVYGEIGKIGKDVVINKDTPPCPKTYYGRSKLEAENKIKKLRNDNFKVVILRPPMIYGSDCPGNYKRLEMLATKVRVFPLIENKRSMLHIDKLCKLLMSYIDYEADGIFLPQDDEYTNTSILVRNIAMQKGKKIYLSKSLGWLINFVGIRSKLINKVFGNLIYSR